MRFTLPLQLVLIAGLPVLAAGQELPPVADGPVPVGPVTPSRFAAAPRPDAPAPFGGRAPGVSLEQVSVGVLGFAAGAIAGYLIGRAGSRSDTDWTPALIGAFAGAPVGTTVAVHAFGRSRGLRSNAFATFGGAVVGMFGGPLAAVTSPFGAAVAYNRFSRAR